MTDTTSHATSHFLQDYTAEVERLKMMYPGDHARAMEAAVGGGYQVMGTIELKLLRYFGLASGIRLLDFGCGSGRLTAALASSGLAAVVQYHGMDIIQDLLDHAATSVDLPRDNFRFTLNTTLSIPIIDGSVDMICAFSVFTHLHQSEIFIYLAEMHRCLAPGGKALVSFQTLEDHWPIFENSVYQHKCHGQPWPHLNFFAHEDDLLLLAEKAGFSPTEAVSVGVWEAPWGNSNEALGQNLLVLTK